MKRYIIAAALVALSASAASAEIFTVTYQGTVTSGVDNAGLFGGDGVDLTGDSFTAVYTINTALGGLGAAPGQTFISGGSLFGLSPAVSAVLTINGHSFDIGGIYFDQDGNCINCSPTYGIHSQAHDSGDNIDLDNDLQSDNPFLTVDFTKPFSYTAQAGDGTFGDFIFRAFDSGTDTLDLSDASVVLAAVSVPEPAAWTLMLAGFAGLGAVLRSRRREFLTSP